MAMGWEDLKTHVGADYEDDAALQRHWSVATALVLNWAAGATVPAVVLDEAILLVAAELFDRAKTPSVNSGQFADSPVAPVRSTRDPLNPAYKILRPWVAPF